MNAINKKAFTLIELLVVISVIALLLAILTPVLGRAKSIARSVVCRSNVRQLVLSNITYASDNDSRFVPAASDIMTTNLNRWHGTRGRFNDPFDASIGPLADYLGDGMVKKCPSRTKFRHGQPWDYDFEDGCGGYGYNMTYIGSRIWQAGTDAYNNSTSQHEIKRPANTVMFADAAMAKLDQGTPYYLEYSFLEPPFFVMDGQIQPSWGFSSPSIHFRHNSQANTGWADAHVDSQLRSQYDEPNVYGVNSAMMELGWFGVLNNSQFDLD